MKIETTDGVKEMSWSGLGVQEIAKAISKGEVSALQVLNDHFDEIDRHNPKVNALVYLDLKGAIDAANAVDQSVKNNQPLPPLAGVPVSIKESFAVKGWPTTCGLEKYRDLVAPMDSPAVVALRQAGAILLGKSNVPASLSGYDCRNPIYGVTSNPWNLAHSPGGSSGGSAAAVAAGFVALDLASDLSGSIRIPASWCGVVGYRPSMGFLSKLAHLPWPLDTVLEPPESVVGLMTKTVHDLAYARGAILDVLGELRSIENAGSGLGSISDAKSYLGSFPRIGYWSPSNFQRVDSATKAAMEATVASLAQNGIKVEEFDISRDLSELVLLARRITDAEISFALNDEAWNTWDQNIFSTRSYLRDLNYAQAIRLEFDSLLKDFDAVICPATPTTAPARTDLLGSTGFRASDSEFLPWAAISEWSLLTSVAQLPSVTMPIAGFNVDLPAAIQVFGRRFSDSTVIQVGSLIEATLNISPRRPSLTRPA